MNRLRLRADEGFTLIELLVVIAIIGILAAIAIPQFAAYRRRGYEADAQSAARNLATAQESYFVANQTYTSTVGNLTGAGGFTQGTKINITTTGGVTKFTVTARNVNCSGTSGQVTFSSSTGKIALATPCT